MEIHFPLRELIKNEITPNQYTIGQLVLNKRWGFLRDFSKTLGEDFYKDTESMRNRGYFYYNAIGNIVPIKEIKVSSKFTNLITLKGDPFTELYNLYPSSVVRPDGEKDYLRGNKAKCIVLYSKILNKNPMVHKEVLEALQYELDYRKDKGHTGYMKRMYNWLKNEEWKIFQEMMQDNIKTKATLEKQKLIKQKRAYGTELL